LQLKAQATYAHYLEKEPEVKIRRLQETIKLAEESLILETAGKSNSYYQVAYCLGRYGQFISVAKALAEGLAGRVRKALEDCLEQAPNHADAHTALGTYQSEIIGKLGRIAAKLTYSASAEESIRCYEKGIELAPYSVSAKTEYADGLISIYGGKKRKQAISLYKQAVEHEPIDALEAMDHFLARKELDEI
jgi:tetratricopeptide (TPR) repeat protein